MRAIWLNTRASARPDFTGIVSAALRARRASTTTALIPSLRNPAASQSGMPPASRHKRSIHIASFATLSIEAHYTCNASITY